MLITHKSHTVSPQVRTWPPNIFSTAQLMESVAAHLQSMSLNYILYFITPLLQVRTWPPNIFSTAQLMESVAARMKRPGGEGRELALIMAELYERQVRCVFD